MSARPTAAWLIAALALAWALVATTFLLLRPAAEPLAGPSESATDIPAEAIQPEQASDEPAVIYQPAEFSDLPGWSQDSLVEALPTLIASCERLAPKPPEGEMSASIGGTAGDWRKFCSRLDTADPADLRSIIEAELRPVEVVDPAGDGLFTGYYEPTLSGSRTRSDRYRWPLYQRPPELVELDLGQFRDRLAGETVLGHVREEAFVPYWERQQIDAGNLAGRGLELVWVDDPVDAFFLHIQGSGRVELKDGSVMRVGYDGQNGHAYTAIGRELVKRGALSLDKVSMQSIRAWLSDHPRQRQAVLHTNPSYIFFRELTGPGPIGSLGAPLTPRRSLAVDRDVVPLGAPVWLVTTAPATDGSEQPLARLMSAQDTGGAIRGAQRGDVFWGPGDEAAEIAGRMKHPGRIWLLLPRNLESTP